MSGYVCLYCTVSVHMTSNCLLNNKFKSILDITYRVCGNVLKEP